MNRALNVAAATCQVCGERLSELDPRCPGCGSPRPQDSSPALPRTLRELVLDHVVTLASKPLGQPVAGTPVDQEPQGWLTWTISRDSFAITACA
jgi:tRNA(Ile2) C34 agmatinyltransferase TiaS